MSQGFWNVWDLVDTMIKSMPVAQDNSPFSFAEHGCRATCTAICGSVANPMCIAVYKPSACHLTSWPTYHTVPRLVTYGSTWMNCFFLGLACWCLRLSTKSLDRLYQSISVHLCPWICSSGHGLSKMHIRRRSGRSLFKSKNLDRD